MTIEELNKKFEKTNHIYKIVDDINLNNGTLKIGEGSTLDFQGGGCFSNGTIEGNNTKIVASPTKIFGLDINLTGSWNIDYIYPEWFKRKEDDYFDSAITKSISLCSLSNSTVLFSGLEYIVLGDIALLSNIRLVSKTNSIIKSSGTKLYKAIFKCDSSIKNNVLFNGLNFDQSNDINLQYSEKSPKLYIISAINISNFTVKSCNFIHCGTNCITVHGGFGAYILNNDFEFFRLTYNNINYDNSTIYVENLYHEICNNRITTKEGIDLIGRGGIETHGNFGKVCFNTIKNMNTSINVVNFNNNNPYKYKSNRLISNNITDTNNFLIFWPIKIGENNNFIENVKICNNNCIVKHWAIGHSQGMEGSLRNITISENNFMGSYHKYEQVESTSSEKHVNNYRAISFYETYGLSNIVISSNVFSDFPSNILTVTSINDKIKDNKEIIFENNIIKNAFNSEATEFLILHSLLALFYISGKNIKVSIKSNNIHFSKLIKIAPRILVKDSRTAVIDFINNKFLDNISYLGLENTLVNHDISFLENYRSPEKNIYNTSESKTLIPGNRILLPDSFNIVTRSGTEKTGEFLEGKFVSNEITNVYNKAYLLFKSVPENLEIGDIIFLKGNLISPQNRQILSIIHKSESEHLIFFTVVSSSGSEPLEQASFAKPVIQKNPKQNWGIDFPEDVSKYTRGTSYYSSRTSITAFSTTKSWVDQFGNPIDALREGTTSQRHGMESTVKDRFQFYDETLGKYVWKRDKSSTKWIDANGQEV